MSKYFESFPRIDYQMKKGDTPKRITDITRRVGFRKDFLEYVSDYYKEVLSSANRPEMLASSAYRDSYKNWILMMANDVVDPYHDWVKDYAAFEEYVDKRYPNRFGLIRATSNYSDTPMNEDYVIGPLVGTFPAVNAFTSGNLTENYPYEIVTLGDTNWSNIGATGSPSVGEVFTKNSTDATGTSGTARPLQPWAQTGSRKIEVLEVETGVTATLYIFPLAADGLSVIGGSAGEYVKPNFVWSFSGGDYFTKGNTLRNVDDDNRVNISLPDMTITSHVVAEVTGADPNMGIFTYNVLTPTTNGASNFTTTDYLITSQFESFSISETGFEKYAPRYYEVSRTNDDSTVERMIVNRTLSADEISNLPSGFSTVPTAVTNLEYESRKNNALREVFIVNSNNIRKIEQELITKMER